MRIRLPKDLRGVLFPKVSTVELNDFDIDLFLPSLFFQILASGKGRARRANDPKAIGLYVDRLAEHPDLEGWTDEEGRRVLERLVRTSLIITGGVGRAKRGEQILSTRPYTLLSHKSGFPSESARQRGTDTFIYQAMRDTLGADDVLRQEFKRYFEKGVVIGPQPVLGGQYDGQTPLDTLTRLSVALMDGFQPTPMGNRRERSEVSPCPALTREMATDLLRYLFAYHDRMPIQALTTYLLGLINLELFMYTLKLVHSVNTLVRNPETLPPAMKEMFKPSPPQTYVDFTGERRGLSAQMANACVRRDVEAYQAFLKSNLLLRQLDRYVEVLRRSPRRKAEIDAMLGGESQGANYLQGLLLLLRDPRVSGELEASARSDEDRIRTENRSEEDDDDRLETLIDAVTVEAETDVERVVLLLIEGQRAKAVTNMMRWYWGTGGLLKPHGILSGTAKNRAGWRYAPQNELLSILVQLAAARHKSGTAEGSGPRPIRLQEFLQFLDHRFGILVDRPPDMFSGPDYAAAARENLQAMLSRLRQMGIFRDLSDDFTVQTLRAPFADEALEVGA